MKITERKHNPSLTANAKNLRKNMTKEERHLWYDFLKTYPLPIHRQYSFGTYIADFYCHRAKLIIELDGSQHYETENTEDSFRPGHLLPAESGGNDHRRPGDLQWSGLHPWRKRRPGYG